MRLLRLGTGLRVGTILSLLVQGCGLSEASGTEIFTLELLNGQPLPGNIETVTQGGHLEGVQVTRQTLRFRPPIGQAFGQVTFSHEGWFVRDSVRVQPVSALQFGSYHRTDSLLVISLEGATNATLLVRANGRILYHSFFPPGPGGPFALTYEKAGHLSH